MTIQKKQNNLLLLTNYMAYGTLRFHAFWNLGVQSRIQKDSSIIPILSRIDPFARTDTYFFKIQTNTASHLGQGLPKGIFPVQVYLSYLNNNNNYYYYCCSTVASQALGRFCPFILVLKTWLSFATLLYSSLRVFQNLPSLRLHTTFFIHLLAAFYR